MKISDVITLSNKDMQVSELNDELDQLLKECEETSKVKVPSSEINKMVDRTLSNLIVGTWFLFKENGHIFVSKEEPMRIKSAWTLKSLEPIGWMQLDEDGSRFFAPPYNALTREMFNKLQLPEVLEENVPLEIEVMPSGNVYFY